MLRSVNWYLLTEVSWQPIGPIFKVMTLEDGTDGLSWNVGMKMGPMGCYEMSVWRWGRRVVMKCRYEDGADGLLWNVGMKMGPKGCYEMSVWRWGRRVVMKCRYEDGADGLLWNVGMKMGPKGCHEMSVTNYQFTLRNIPEEWRTNMNDSNSLLLLLCLRRYLACFYVLIRNIKNRYCDAASSCILVKNWSLSVRHFDSLVA